ncbi:MAG: hypothetical protein AB1629_00855 [Candidatus Omnitrophota bacterium]
MRWPEENIPDEHKLFRRIHPNQYIREEDRISSAAFRGKKNYDCSVNWEKYTTPEKAVRNYHAYHLAALQAKIPRQLEQEVKHTPSRRDRSHSSIIGNKTESIAKSLALSCVFVIKR